MITAILLLTIGQCPGGVCPAPAIQHYQVRYYVPRYVPRQTKTVDEIKAQIKQLLMEAQQTDVKFY